MKTVSQQFLDELIKPSGMGESQKVYLEYEGEIKDLTPIIIGNSLNRIDQQVEEAVNYFAPGEANFSVIDNAELWTWIQEHDPIRLTMKSGFPFERITSFTGFIDKRNTSRKLNRMIDIRAHPVDWNFKQVKVSDVEGWGNINPALVKDVVAKIFDAGEITNQEIHVTPIDTEDYIDNYNQLNIPDDYISIGIPVSDHVLFFAGTRHVYKVTWTADYDDYELDTIEYPSGPYAGESPVNFEQWENYFCVVFGKVINANFYDGGSSYRTASDLEATRIIMFNADGSVANHVVVQGIVVGAYKYYATAHSISYLFSNTTGKKWIVVGYNGSYNAVSAYDQVRHSALRWFDISTPTVPVQAQYFHDKYIYPFADGSGSSKDCNYVVPVVEHLTQPDSVWILIKSFISGNYYLIMPPGAYSSALFWGGGVKNFYDTFVFNGAKDQHMPEDNAYNTTGLWVAASGSYSWSVNFLPSGYQYFGEHSHTTRNGVPICALTMFNSTTKKFWLKKVEGSSVTTETMNYPVREFYFWDSGEWQAFNYSFFQGCVYWQTTNGHGEYVFMPDILLSNQSYIGNMGILGWRFFPFVDITLFEEKDSLLDLLSKLAQTFNAVYFFPDFDTGRFQSRQYVGSEFALSLKHADKLQYEICTEDLYDVLVHYGEEEYLKTIDHAMNRITIDTGLTPPLIVVAKAIANIFFNFFNDKRLLISTQTDFLIFLEPFDYINFFQKYYCHVFRMSKEGMKVKLEMRGAAL